MKVGQLQKPVCNDYKPVWTLFKNLFAMITSLSELYFRIQKFLLLVQMKKSDFYEIKQHQKQLKTMEISEAWPDTFDEGYIHQFQSEPTHKIHEQQQKHWVQRCPPMEDLSDDNKDCPNHHKNSQKICNERGHPLVNMKESQWKLRQQHDQNLRMEEKPL